MDTVETYRFNADDPDTALRYIAELVRCFKEELSEPELFDITDGQFKTKVPIGTLISIAHACGGNRIAQTIAKLEDYTGRPVRETEKSSDIPAFTFESEAADAFAFLKLLRNDNDRPPHIQELVFSRKDRTTSFSGNFFSAGVGTAAFKCRGWEGLREFASPWPEIAETLQLVNQDCSEVEEEDEVEA